MIKNRINVFIKLSIFAFTLLSVKENLHAQYYDLGQDPARTKWAQIQTTHFKIIFPEQNEKQAQNLANYIESIYSNATNTLKSYPTKIPIILHTESVNSNAYSIWAPKRIEFYTIPPQDLYGQEWIQQLAIHEFRHIIQVNKLNQGASKILYYFFGEQITGAIFGIYLPAWFIEGDAVCTETGLSNMGRGRIPSFEMELKAQTLNKKIYQYDKAVFGSYKDHIPNQYILGYNLTAYTRKKYGPDVWNNTLDFVARHPLGITSFSRGIKKNTGLSKSKLYHNVLYEIDSLWKNQQSNLTFTSFENLTKTSKNYTNYKFPQYLNDSTIIAIKRGIDDITRFVSIDKQKNEKILFTPGFLISESFSLVDSTLTWAEMKYDLRWNNRLYNSIKILDLRTGKCKEILQKSYLFSPSLSFDKKLLAAIENTPEGENNIVIVESESGNIIKKITSPAHTTLLTPTWSNDNNRIALIAVSDQGKSLLIYDMVTDQYITIIPFCFEEISMPVFYENYLTFNAGYTGIDNIYAIDTLSRTRYQITSSEFGAENIKISGNGQDFIYSDYTSNGYIVAGSIVNKNHWIITDTITDHSIKLYETIKDQEIFLKKETLKTDSIYKIRKYPKIKNIFHFHSWAPLCIDAENTSLNPGFSIFSQNLLSTAFTSIGYKYNPGEKTGLYFVNFTYKGFYPVIDIKMSKGSRASTYTNENNENIRYEWNETKLNTKFSIPFNISKGKYYRIIEPQIGLSNIYIQNSIYAPDNFTHGSINYLDYSLQFYNQIKSVAKDMRPRWGQILEMKYANNPFEGLDLGEIYALTGKFYFPGIIKHHSLKLSLGYQYRNYGTYTYSDFIELARGATSIKNKEMKTFFIDYKMPLAYPDFSIPNIIYIKRIKANLFYDFSQYQYLNQKTKFRSTGIETTMDFHLFRFIAPFDAGLRVTYVPTNKHLYPELLYQIKFDNL